MGLFDGFGGSRAEELLDRAESEPLAVREDAMRDLLDELRDGDRPVAVRALVEVMAAVREAETDKPSAHEDGIDDTIREVEALEADVEQLLDDASSPDDPEQNVSQLAVLDAVVATLDDVHGDDSETATDIRAGLLLAATILARLVPNHVRDELGTVVRALSDRDPAVRRRALLVCRLTVEFGKTDVAGVPEAGQQLSLDHDVEPILARLVEADPDPDARTTAAELLRLMGAGGVAVDPDTVRNELVGALTDESPDVSLTAGQALLAVIPFSQPLPDVGDAVHRDGWLYADDPVVQATGARLLARYGTEDALTTQFDDVLRVYEDATHQDTLTAALEALSTCVAVDPDVPPGLLDAVTSDLEHGPPPVRDAASGVFRAIAGDRPESVEPYVPVLRDALADVPMYDVSEAESGLARSVIKTLGHLEVERARDQLADFSTHDDELVANAAQEVLHRISEHTTEFDIRHEGDGDVLAGENVSKTHSEQHTSVEDSVVNRSDVGAETSPAETFGGPDSQPAPSHCSSCGESLADFDDIAFCPFCGQKR